MDVAESLLLDIVHRFCSWIPRRPKPLPMSRDFWMSDESCRVCYECDSPFTLFNRRHHCRICGRIFCGKCTLNTLPAGDCRPGICEDGERVRVCNFCFKIKQEESRKEEEQKVVKSPNPTITPSSSSFSLASSSSTSSSSTSSTASSSVNPGQVPAPYCYRSTTTARVESNNEKKQRRTVRTGRSSRRSYSPRGRELSPNPYDFCSNRSDEDETDDPKNAVYHKRRVFEIPSQDEEEDDSCIDMEAAETNPKYSQNLEYSMTKTEDINDVNKHCENTGLKIETPTVERSLSKRSILSSDDYDGPEESMDESNLYTPSLIGETSPVAREEVLDVENNDSLWIAPPPEDEEDEMGMCLADDDDDDESGWGSISSSDYRTREKAAASDEQRKAMRAVVDGHFRALVGQLLDGEGLGIEESGDEGWLEIVSALALQAASLIKPDTSKDGGMDPGGYVKVKCITAGRRFESCVVKGIVCKKNVAHRRMTSRYKSARILLLGGALEYQRVSNQLSSLDTLLQQEKDHLSMAVSRIEAHHPNVVLVEKTVARQAQERLLSKEISLVLNVRRHLLERIARCTGAEIVPSPDHLIKSRIGHCELFHVEKFVEELGVAGQGGKKLPKTLMFFEGCPRPLGCTVLLKGSNEDELKKVKRVVQYAVFAAYQLALETSFLVDEGATLPELPFKSPISVALPEKQSKFDRSISIVPGFLLPGQTPTREASQGQPNHLVEAHPTLPLAAINIPRWGDVGRKMSNTSISVPWSVTSSCVSSRTNSPDNSPRTGEHQGFDRKISSNNYLVMGRGNPALATASAAKVFGPPFLGGPISVSSNAGFSQDYQPRGEHRSSFIHDTVSDTSPEFRIMKTTLVESKTLEGVSKTDGLYEEGGAGTVIDRLTKAESNLSITQSPQFAISGESGLGDENDANPEEFPPSPSDHQSILVSFSSSCRRRGTVCVRGHLFRIKYYGSFDKPLGRFLRDNVFDLTNTCGSCEETRDAHIHCYMHRQGSLTISVHRRNQVLTGDRDGKIWMWHRCLKCPRENGVPPPTHRVLMSDAAWGLSFGKFLELSFSNHAAASRLAACGHSLHRDCLRFYGFGDMVACFRYAPINVHSVYLPPSKLEFNHPELDEWLLNEIGEVTDKGKLIFAEVLNALRQIEERVSRYGTGKAVEARRRIVDYETLLINDQKAFWETLQRVATMRRETGHLFADILELNTTRRSLSLLSSRWNERFRHLQDFLRLQKSSPVSRSANLGEPSVFLSKMDVGAEVGGSNEVLKASIEPILDVSEHSNTVSPSVSDTSSQAGSMIPNGSFHFNEQVAARQADDSMNYSSQTGESLHNGGVPSCEDVVRPEIDASNTSMSVGTEGVVKTHATDDFFNQFSEENGNPKVWPSLDTERSLNQVPVLSKDSSEESEMSGTATHLSGDSNNITLLNEKDKLFEDKDSFQFHVAVDDLLVRRTLSEGQFPLSTDLPGTLEAGWTGKGQTVEAHTVSILSNGQEISSQASGVDATATIESSTIDSTLESNEGHRGLRSSLSLQEMSGSGNDNAILASSAISPVKVGEPFDNLGGWVGTPFSSLYRSYSRSSQSALMGSPPLFTNPQILYSSSTMLMPGKEARILAVGIDNTVIPVYDDEPTSIIAYAITSHQYQNHLVDRALEREKSKEREREADGKGESAKNKEADPSSTTEAVVSHPLQFVEGSLEQVDSKTKTTPIDDTAQSRSKENGSLQYFTATHVKVSFTDDGSQGKIKYMVTCYYAKEFDALRKKCCPDTTEFIRSLCRCKKWGAQGGKSNVFFAKTADDRLVIKQVTKTELESFIKFAPDYFKYLSDALTSGSPTCLAKVLGIFQVTIKHGKGSREVRMDLMAMENLLYGRHVTRLYDLKGSLRSRYNADATGKNKVLLDQNLMESMSTNPIFIGNKAKRILERAVWNDTSFLASMDVMDYSLLVGVDEERRELVLGIIDFMRQYTWDKHLETWVKASGILGGPKNAAPTVISPKQYKKRFRKAMKNYFLMVPDQWSPPVEILGPSSSQVDSVSVENCLPAVKDQAPEEKVM